MGNQGSKSPPGTGASSPTGIPRQNWSDTASSWEVVHTGALSDWFRSDCNQWGFDPRINYTSRSDQRMQPWSTGGRDFVTQIPAPETQDRDMCAEDMYSSMIIEEKRNKYQTECVHLPVTYFKDGVKFAEAIGYKDGIILLEVATSHSRMDFLFVDLSRDIVKLIHSECSPSLSYLCDCALAPDMSCMIIKPNPLYVQFGELQNIPNELKLVHFKRNGSKSMVLSVADCKNYSELTFAFDPCYRHSRVAFANWIKSGSLWMGVFDLNTDRFVTETCISKCMQNSSQRLIYSPGGLYLANLVRKGTSTTLPVSYKSVTLYHTGTLDLLHEIPLVNNSHFGNYVPSAIFPVFSTSGSHIAIGIGKASLDNSSSSYNKICAVEVRKVAPMLNLQRLCRTKIRLVVLGRHVPYLPLPSSLKKFLLFFPFCD